MNTDTIGENCQLSIALLLSLEKSLSGIPGWGEVLPCCSYYHSHHRGFVPPLLSHHFTFTSLEFMFTFNLDCIHDVWAPIWFQLYFAWTIFTGLELLHLGDAICRPEATASYVRGCWGAMYVSLKNRRLYLYCKSFILRTGLTPGWIKKQVCTMIWECHWSFETPIVEKLSLFCSTKIWINMIKRLTG